VDCDLADEARTTKVEKNNKVRMQMSF
jgi:hypothetical protein